MSEIFSTTKFLHHRNRAMNFFPKYDYLFEHVAKNIISRLILSKKYYKKIIEIGSRSGVLTNEIMKCLPKSEITVCDNSRKILTLSSNTLHKKYLIEKELILLNPVQYDLLLSSLYVHWINNLPLFLDNIKNLLRENGFALLAFIGGNSLSNLREFFIKNELKFNKPITPHISPFIRQETILKLCKDLKMQSIIIDTETIEVEYQNCYSLIKELSLMGESNCLVSQENYSISKALLMETKNSGKFIDKFEIIYCSYFR